MKIQIGLTHGVYKIYWKGGGKSLASIGYTYDGTNWFAPCNWTTESNTKPLVASTDWGKIKKIKLIKLNKY